MDLIFAEKGIREIVIDYLTGSNFFWLWRNDACMQDIKESKIVEDVYIERLWCSRTNIMNSVTSIIYGGSFDFLLNVNQYPRLDIQRMIEEYVGWINPYYSTFEQLNIPHDAQLLLQRNKIWNRKLF